MSAGQEGFDVGSGQIDSQAESGGSSNLESAGTADSPASAAVEDRPLPIPQSLSETGVFWDEILVAIIVVIGTIATYFIIRYFLNRAADSLQLEKGQLKGVLSITKLALIVIAIIVIIFQFSSMSGAAAGAISVAAGTIIGFSSRNTISNAIAGILLLSSRPFKIGDRIRTSTNDDLIGDVIEITIIYTKLRTIRNELITVPNQMLLQQQIINYSGLVDKVHRSIELYEKRVPDRRFIFQDNYQRIKRTKILEIRSPNSGVIRSLDWEKISDHMRKHKKFQKLEQEEPLLFLEWLTPVGGKVKEKEVIAIMYSNGELPGEKTEHKENIQEYIESVLQEAISSGLKIAQNRSVSSDPYYGLEIIRNFAIKATNQSDIATITSCITGLFSILYGTTQEGQMTGTPFMIPLTDDRNNNLDNRFLLTTDLGERPLAEGVLSELSLIYHISGKSKECAISVAEHFAKSYVDLSRELLGKSKMKDFERLTEWYAKQTSLAISSHPPEFRHRLADTLEKFKKEIGYSHPYATDTFQIHLNKILTS